MEHSSHIVAQHACDLERPMPLRVGVAPSFESLGVVAESSSTEGSFGIPAQAASIHSYFLQREGGSSSATEKLSKPTQSRPDLSTDSGRSNTIVFMEITNLIQNLSTESVTTIIAYQLYHSVTAATFRPLPMRRWYGVRAISPSRQLQWFPISSRQHKKRP